MRDRSLESQPSGGHVAGAAASPTRALALATISFAVSFVAWGLVGGLASVFTGLYQLTASQTALLVAVPVLLGSLARLPMGMLTDRFGGRLVFTALLVFSSLAAFVVPLTGSYASLLVAAFLIGMPGSSFAVGAAFVSRWTPAARQGTALGVYGLGTMGQSLAVFVGPVVAARLGWEMVFHGTGALLLAWAVAYFLLARNPPQPGPSRHGRRDDRDPAPRAHRLAARRLLLPDLRRLRRVLDLPADAAAGAVRPGSSRCRIPGRWIRRARHADAARRRVAGGPDRRRPGPVVGLRRRRPVLAAPDVAVDGAVHGRRARVRDADGTGQRRRLQAGAGALPEGHRHGDRPRRRPRRAGRVLPAAAARRLPRSTRRHLARVPPAVCDRACCCARPISASSARATSHGRSPCRWPRVRRSSGSGPARGPRSSRPRWRRRSSSGRADLQHFDAALVGYTFATLFAAFGISYRYAMWLQRPPTRMYWRRGWQAFFSRRARGRQHRQPRTPRAAGVCRQRVHLPARPAPRARALADHVGLRARGGDHVSAGLGLDPLRDRPRRPAHVSHVRVRHCRCRTFRSSPPSPSSSSTGWSGRRSWSLPA